MEPIFRIFLSSTKVGKWIIRVHKPRTSNTYDQLHVHITRSKLKGEYSWNLDGTRHDKHRFPKNEKGIAMAKELAARTLNVPAHTLQLVTVLPKRYRISIHSVSEGGRNRSLFTTYIRADEMAVLFGSQKELAVIVFSTPESKKLVNQY